MKSLFYICLVAVLWGLAACAGPLDRRVEHVLDVAGDNRGELEAVLAHYRDDPEKLHAARLLIAEMEEAYYYDGPEVDSLRRPVRLRHGRNAGRPSTTASCPGSRMRGP